jgi:hypothetical protein
LKASGPPRSARTNGASVPDTAHTHVMNAGLSCEASYIQQHGGCRFFVSGCGRFGDRYHHVTTVTAWRALVERPNSEADRKVH